MNDIGSYVKVAPYIWAVLDKNGQVVGYDYTTTDKKKLKSIK